MEACEKIVLMAQEEMKSSRAREQSALREQGNNCRKLEEELSKSRTSIVRLQEECVQLSSEVKESNNRSLVMEVGLHQVLEDSKKFAGTKEEVSSMQRDLASAFVLIQKLCASIDRQEPLRNDDSLLEAISGDIFGAGQDLRRRGVEACNRVVAMHSELMQVVASAVQFSALVLLHHRLLTPCMWQVKTKVIELQDLNRKLSAEVEDVSNRSVVMEVMAKEALDESKRYEDQKPHVQMMEKDLENAFVYIQKLCAAIHGKESPSSEVTALSEATGRYTFSVGNCAMACSMACESAQNLRTQLSQSKAKQARLEVQHQEHIEQHGRLQRAVHEMEAVARRAEQSILRLKQDNSALERKVHGGKLSLKAQLTAKTAQCEKLQSMLDDALSSKDMSQSAFSRESSLLRYQLERISFDFDSVVRDLNDAFESSLHREADLNTLVEEYKTQQKVLSVMMDRIWLVVAAQVEGTQAWCYLETAMATDQVSSNESLLQPLTHAHAELSWLLCMQVSQVSEGLPEKADEICRVITRMRDRLVACETEADTKNDVIASQAREVRFVYHSLICCMTPACRRRLRRARE